MKIKLLSLLLLSAALSFGQSIVIVSPDTLISTNDSSYQTWQGLATIDQRGPAVQRENIPATVAVFGVYSSGLAATSFEGQVAGGSFGSLSAPSIGSSLYIRFRAYNGSAFVQTANMAFFTTEVPGTGGHGSGLWLQTVRNGELGNPQPRLGINGAGDVEVYQTLEVYEELKVEDGDAEIETIGKGVILKSPNGSRWRITVDNAGALVTTAL